jgi:hypothetical protein
MHVIVSHQPLASEIAFAVAATAACTRRLVRTMIRVCTRIRARSSNGSAAHRNRLLRVLTLIYVHCKGVSLVCIKI